MEYYILDRNNQPYGPFTLLKLREMKLNSKSFVWAKGWDKWVRAGEVEEINKYVLHAHTERAAAAPVPPTPPVQHTSPVAEPKPAAKPKPEAKHRTISFSDDDAPTAKSTPKSKHTETASQPAKPMSKRRRRSLVWALVIFALICVLTSTNPNIFAHRRAAREVVEEAVQADISSGNTSGKDYPNGTSVDNIFDASLVYHNYYLFSTTTIQLRRTTHFLSLGILGQVFTVSAGML